MAYRWSPNAGRFIDARGRFVSERAVRAVVDSVADAASDRMAAAAQRLLNGEQSLAAFQAEAQQIIKLSQMAASVIAHGGVEQMTSSHYGSAGRAIRDQYVYMRQFAADIASGKQPLNGSLTARARQYGQQAHAAFEREYGRDQRARGFNFERNILAPAEHCRECREQTARGLVPIGSLVPVGQRTCRGNCRCSIRYARTIDGERAA